MPCRSRNVENSRRNDKEVARLLRVWVVLGASTIIAITTILSYGIFQSESVFSVLNAAATSGAATTDDALESDDDYGGGDEDQQRFLGEDDNYENEEEYAGAEDGAYDGDDDNYENEEEYAGAEDGTYDDDDNNDNDDASEHSSSNFSLNLIMPKYTMDVTDLFFLALMLVIALILLPFGRQVLKDRKALNSRFGIGSFSSALIMYANLSFLFSLLLSYSGEVSRAIITLSGSSKLLINFLAGPFFAEPIRIFFLLPNASFVSSIRSKWPAILRRHMATPADQCRFQTLHRQFSS